MIGVDGGGTSTRALVMALDGTRLGTGYAGGANPNAHPPADAAAHLDMAVRDALTGLDPGRARAAVLGVAGHSRLADPEVAALFERAWRDAGVRCRVRAVNDAEVAFASATGAPDGTALVAGTGSIAIRIAGHRRIATEGGLGWLLGDEGSAFWIGREAIRATVQALRRGQPLGMLAGAVLTEALGPGRSATDDVRLITAVNAGPPISLARFAPLVTEADAAGDQAAASILDAAADTLAALAAAVRDPRERTPVVLIGGLVQPGGPLTQRLRSVLRARTGGEVLLAGEPAAGAAGAAWLAALDVLGPQASRPQPPPVPESGDGT